MSTFGNAVEDAVTSTKQRQVKVVGDKAVIQVSGFDDPRLNLDKRLLAKLIELDHKEPTPIQSYGMPQISKYLDVMCVSHTGSGKTCTYLVPIINHLLGENDKGTLAVGKPQALIIVPTRELAEQIQDYANKLMKGLGPFSVVLFGGDSMSKERFALRTRSNGIIVATPGRLRHMLDECSKDFSLKTVKFLVLDEADELFDRDFFKEINDIAENFMVPKEDRVNIMISATFQQQIRYYATKHLRQEDHVFIVVGGVGAPAPNIYQEILCVSEIEKQSRLFQMYDEGCPDTMKILVFLNTIEKVNLLASCMEIRKMKFAVIHSDLPQHTRDQAVDDLNKGRIRILISTDVASRGLNLKGVTIVINYDMPRHKEDYIQRIGRIRPLPETDAIPTAVSFFDLEYDKTDCLGYLLTALAEAGQEAPAFLIEEDLKDKRVLREYEEAYGPCDDMTRLSISKLEFRRAEVFPEEEFLG